MKPYLIDYEVSQFCFFGMRYACNIRDKIKYHLYKSKSSDKVPMWFETYDPVFINIYSPLRLIRYGIKRTTEEAMK